MAALSFALFLLNPLQMEAVVWVSGLQEVLWTFFVLAGLVVYTGARVLSPWRVILTTAFVASALLAKETAVAAILLLPAADWALFRMKRGRLLAVAYAAVAFIAVGYLVVRESVMSMESEFLMAPSRYFLQKFIATPYKSFVQPWNLTAAHVPAVLLCCAAVLAFTVLFFAVVRGAGPMALTGPAVILMSTLPVYSYFFVGEDLRSARYIYFAAFGWALLVTQLLATLLVRRRAFAATFIALAVVMFVSLQVNIRPWRTAGKIAHDVETSLIQGRAPARRVDEWQAQYGTGFEVKDGIPTAYRGVNIFLNGYPELVSTISASRKIGSP